MNSFLNVKEIPKPQKPCWPYGHFKIDSQVFHRIDGDDVQNLGKLAHGSRILVTALVVC